MERPLAHPDELRCCRSDGKSWRCKSRRTEGKSLCEAHHRQLMSRMNKYSALSRHKNRAAIRIRLAKSKKSSDSISSFIAGLSNGPIKRKQGYLRTAVRRKKNLNCHQCHRNDKGRVVECSTCRKKKYCIPCIMRWYPQLSEAGCAISCPSCRNICNCKSCLRTKWVAEPLRKNIKLEDKIRHYCYMIHMLLPLVKIFCEEQAVEKEIDAKILGVLPTEMKLQQAICSADKHIYCNNCKASILDFHRRCTNCSYILCINCCRKLREGCLLGHSTVAVQYEDRGKAYLHGGAPRIIRGQESSVHKHVKFFTCPERPLKDWKVNTNQSIPCPSKELGGCGDSLLELVCTFPDNWLLELKERAETFAGIFGIAELPDFSTSCTCLNPSEMSDFEQKVSRKAAVREASDDNYLYSPNASEIQEGELEHFQRHWFKGEPVIVRDVLDITSGLSWEPMVIWRALRERTKMKAESDLLLGTTINCLDWCEVGMNIYKFFRGYTKGCTYNNQWPMMLKLKDWPPAKYLRDRLRRHCDVFMNSLPYQEYTDPRFGLLNIAVNMRDQTFKPDLGPKTYFAYGLKDELGRGDSVTKLHSHIFDVVNVLTHVAKVDLSSHQISEIKKLKRRHKDQDIIDNLHDGKFSGGTNTDGDEMFSHGSVNVADGVQAKVSAVPTSATTMYACTASDGQFLLSANTIEERGHLENPDIRTIGSILEEDRSNKDAEAVAEIYDSNKECELPVCPIHPKDKENAKNRFKKLSSRNVDLENELGEKIRRTEERTNKHMHISALEAENKKSCLSGVSLNCTCISCLTDAEATNSGVNCSAKAEKRKIVERGNDIGGPPGFPNQMDRVVKNAAFGALQNKANANNLYMQTNICGGINVIQTQLKNNMVTGDAHIKLEVCEEMHEVVGLKYGDINYSEKRKTVEHGDDIGGPPGFPNKMDRVVKNAAFGALQNKADANNLYLQTNICGDINVIQTQLKNNMVTGDAHIKLEVCEEMHEVVGLNHGEIHYSVVEGSNIAEICDTSHIPTCRKMIDEAGELDVVDAGVALQNAGLSKDRDSTEVVEEVARTKEPNNGNVCPFVVKTETVAGLFSMTMEDIETHFEADQVRGEKLVETMKNRREEMRSPPGFITKLGKELNNAVLGEKQIKEGSRYSCLGSQSNRETRKSEGRQGHIENETSPVSDSNKLNAVEKRAELPNLGLENIEQTVSCNDQSLDPGKHVKRRRNATEKMKRIKPSPFGNEVNSKPHSLGIMNDELVQGHGMQNLPDTCYPGLSIIGTSTTDIDCHNQSIVYRDVLVLDKVGTDLENQTNSIIDEDYLVKRRMKFRSRKKKRQRSEAHRAYSASAANDSAKRENQNRFIGCNDSSLLDKFGSDVEKQTNGTNNDLEKVAEYVKRIVYEAKKMEKSEVCEGNLKRNLLFITETEINGDIEGNSVKGSNISVLQESSFLASERHDVEKDQRPTHFNLSPVKYGDTSKNIENSGGRIHIECKNMKREESWTLSEHKTLPEQSQGGVLWDIFRREDAVKLQEYLKEHSREFRHIHCAPVEEVVHPIHDQAFYLTLEHKSKLKTEYGIEPWTFVQNFGEAVLIPAGCPHQARNLMSCINVAVNFLSPESICDSIRLTEEIPVLPQDHRDKLEVKKMAIHTIDQIVTEFEELFL